MRRTNVYYQTRVDDTGHPDDWQPLLEGWFDYDKAERFPEGKEWDGNNMVSVITGSQWDHEALLRTKQGRWVLETYSNRQGVMETYRFVGGNDAREWLIRNGDDEIVARFFGEIEEERGPGRPVTVGGEPVNVRLGDLLGQVDAYASKNGISSRAEAIRVLVAAGLNALLP